MIIQIVSDFVCPWCFVGERRLAQAVAQLKAEQPELTLSFRWLPYFLNFGTPPEGESYSKFMEGKFGSAAQVSAMQQRVLDAGRESGVDFDFGLIRMRPNTLRAHRLIYRAQSAGYSSEHVLKLADRLFSGYFQRGENIGDIDVLAAIAVECCNESADNIDEELKQVIDYLKGDEGMAQVLAQYEQVTGWGVSGVPFFIFGQNLGVAGAQTTDVLVGAIRQALLPPD